MSRRRVTPLIASIAILVVMVITLIALRGVFFGPASTGTAALPPIPPVDSTRVPGTTVTRSLRVADSLAGRSGALRFRTLTPAEANALPGFVGAFGERALHTPAMHFVSRAADNSFALIVLLSFGAKRGEMLNGYRLGLWPAERWMMATNYFNPRGFVQVTPGDTSLPLSAHFTLGEFLTHDQGDIWPKYVVLEEKLIDKLELVLAELNAAGVATNRVVVLSGFRAPYYNDRGAGEGMARASRHMFGDAADIIIDNDGDGRMDDLNRDGRLDLRDTEPITRAIARVEGRFPVLVGGVGTYQATGPRGPFAHIDVRGTSARWERRHGLGR